MAIPTLGAMIAAIGSPAEWAAVSTAKLAWDDSTSSLFISGAITGSQPAGLIKVGGGGDSWYGMGTSTSAGGATAVGGYYPYAINNHTGLAFSAHTAYGGIRFYNQPYSIAPMGATAVMAVVNGRVGILTESPSQALGVAGNIYASGNYQGVSSTSYGSIEVGGQKGNYTGIYFPSSDFVTGMYYKDDGGYGGDYDNHAGKWVYYYNRADSCLSIGSPWTTNSSYRLYVTGPTYMRSDGAVNTVLTLEQFNTTTGGQYGGLFYATGAGASNTNIALYAYAVSGGEVSWGLYVAGGLTYCAAGAWNSSDMNKKKDVQTLTGSIDKLKQIRGISHQWKTEEFPELEQGTHYGLVAQELGLIFPHMVKTIKHKDPRPEKKDDPEEEFLAIQPTSLIPWLLEGIKELSGMISTQTKTTEDILTRLEKLEGKP